MRDCRRLNHWVECYEFGKVPKTENPTLRYSLGKKLARPEDLFSVAGVEGFPCSLWMASKTMDEDDTTLSANVLYRDFK